MSKYEKLGNCCTSVEVYSEKTKTWKHRYINFEERFGYCLCSFMSKMYIIGGYVRNDKNISSTCYTYNIKTNERIDIADLNQARSCAACKVFEGKIVVTGGFSSLDSCQLKSVKSYDYYENKWTYLPDMNDKRCFHAAVSMGNKLFVIGGIRTTSCEMFDSCSRIFININSEMKVSALDKYYFRAFCVGYYILVFHHSESLKTVIYLYDISGYKWL